MIIAPRKYTPTQHMLLNHTSAVYEKRATHSQTSNTFIKYLLTAKQSRVALPKQVARDRVFVVGYIRVRNDTNG